MIEAWDAWWPTCFVAVRDELRGVFAPLDVQVEHIGSTSVPGLAAKPVIDVMLGAASLELVASRIAALQARGYAYVPQYEDVLPERRYFRRSPGALPRIHLHAVVTGSAMWRGHLAFRDALRADKDLRARYQDLKLRLAREHAADKAAYTEAKGPFIRAVIEAALGRGAGA